MSYKVPILFIVFNRLDTTKKVFEAIKQYRPDKLYVASDGARKKIPNEIENVKQIRDFVIRSIDWNCKVETFFRDENVGCGRGPSEAITWFFEHEEMGIILEDDCVPSLSFFPYCEYLLNKYQYNTQVWIISGRSHYAKSKYFEGKDYLFSNYVTTWGWATWKRCWDKFDADLKNYWQRFYIEGGFENVFFSKKEGVLRNIKYKRLMQETDLLSHAWDYQFLLQMYLNRGLAIIPSKNLVENIGYEGTHFFGITKLQRLKSFEEYSVKEEPKYVLTNRRYETHQFYNILKKKFSNLVARIFTLRK